MSPLEALRACWGAVELVLPEAVIPLATGERGDRPTLMVARVLGVRHLAQAALTRRGGRVAHALGAAVDLSHAASMVLLAAVNRDRARQAGTSAAIAASFALAEIVASARGGRRHAAG